MSLRGLGWVQTFSLPRKIWVWIEENKISWVSHLWKQSWDRSNQSF